MDVPDFFQRNSIEPPANCDAQVFLVDTEGFNGLDGSSANFKAIFAMQVSFVIR